ncbi:MAG: class I SAM-dependent methyltransferase [Thermoplasmata archaeon]
MKRRIPADLTEIYALRADTIDLFFGDRTEEKEFWSSLASKYGDDVLHLMCGTGEITVGLAGKGFDVVGVDLTKSMIYEARDRKKEKDTKNVEFKTDDARYFDIKKKFDFIFISTGDFHHFTEEEDMNKVLARCYAHLKPGGALALELFKMPEDDFKNEPKKFEPLREPPENMDVWKINKSGFHSDSQMLEIREELHVEVDGELSIGEYEIQLQLFSEEEIEDALMKNGFENITKIKGTDSSSLRKNTNTWVITAER